MRYYSTNHQSRNVSFRDAMLQSDAPDGGLYMPEKLPNLPKAFTNNIAEMSLRDITYVISSMLFDGDLPAHMLKRMADETLSFPLPLKQIEPGIFALELFHGPTQTVKDISSLFMTNILRHLHPDPHAPLSVLLATTGNSGSAVANSLHNMRGINVFMLYPRDIPQHFLSFINPNGDNIHPIEVSGTIDDCRRIISTACNDNEMRSSLQITSANSFNIGNLLPYTILYFHAYSQLLSKVKNPEDIQIAVPCGNCGNILAGYMALKMGLPVDRLIGACNANGAFHHFLNGTAPASMRVIHTYAHSMDSKVSANHDRFIDLCDGDISRLRQRMTSTICSDPQIAETILDVYERTGYILDPHGATAYRALKDNLTPGGCGVFFATAHPSRSSEAMTKISNGKFELPVKNLRLIRKGRKPVATIAPTLPALKKFLRYSGFTDDQVFRV